MVKETEYRSLGEETLRMELGKEFQNEVARIIKHYSKVFCEMGCDIKNVGWLLCS